MKASILAASFVPKESGSTLCAPILVAETQGDVLRAACMPPLQRRLAKHIVLLKADAVGAPVVRRLQKMRQPVRRVLAMFLLVLMSAAMAGCSQSPVSIEKFSPSIKTEFFDKGARPPEANTPDHNDCANTHWHFGFFPEIGWELVKRERSSEGENVVIKIKSAKLTLKLDITMWLPEKASQDVIAHEKGHAAICLDAYKQAEKVAQDAANSMIGQKVEAHGPDYESTLKSALTNVYQDLARKYREETLDKANVTSAFYDKITMKDHAASKVDSKVEDAELQYEHLAPELKKQRAEEERIIRDMVEKQKRKVGRKQNAAPERKDPTAADESSRNSSENTTESKVDTKPDATQE